MRTLESSPYFTKKEENRENTAYIFNEAEFQITIQRNQAIWWDSPFGKFDENPYWFQELYATAYLETFEKRRMKMLLDEKALKIDPFIEYVRAKSVLKKISLPEIVGNFNVVMCFPKSGKELYEPILKEAGDMVGLNYDLLTWGKSIEVIIQEGHYRLEK